MTPKNSSPNPMHTTMIQKIRPWLASTLTAIALHGVSTATNIDGYPVTCNDPVCCDVETGLWTEILSDCSSSTEGNPFSSNPGSGGLNASLNFGRAPFERPTDFSGMFAASSQNGKSRRFPETIQGVRDYFEGGGVKNLWDVHFQVRSRTIDADAFKISSLDYNHAQKMEVIKSGGVVRQVMTHDFLVDLQPLAAPDEGYEVRWWFAGDAGAQDPVTKIYALPAANHVKRVTIENSTPFQYTAATVECLVQYDSGSGMQEIAPRCGVAPSGTGGLPEQYVSVTPGPTSGGNNAPRCGVGFISGLPGNSNNQVRIRTIELPDLSAAGSLGANKVLQRIREEYSDIGGEKRLTKRTVLDDLVTLTDGLTTTFGYYNDPSNPGLHARKRWQKNPDGSWAIWQITATPSSQSIKLITPFKDGSFVLSDNGSNIASVVEAEARVETQIVNGTEMETFTDILGQRVSRVKEAFLTGQAGERILRTRRYYNTTDFLTRYTAHHPYGDGTSIAAGRIAWEVGEDGTGTVYSYASDPSGTLVTVKSGAATGSGASTAPTITSGSKSEITYNTAWNAILTENFDIATGLTLDSWMGTIFDIHGRVTRRFFDGDPTDYETTSYDCCGIGTRRDRTGATTTYSRDAFRRVYKVEQRRSSGGTPIITTTGRVGLVTTQTVTAGAISFDTSVVTRNLLGETTSRKSADADGDVADALEETTYLIEYPGAGRKVTTTYPDSTAPVPITTVRVSYRDGQPKTSTDQQSNVTTYDFGVHATDGGGRWSKRTEANTSQWTKSHSDHLGRSTKTEFPGGAFSTKTYHPATASAGSRGRLSTTTDPDENDTAGTGSTASYTYSAEGEPTSAETIADGHTRTSTTESEVVATVTLHTTVIAPALLSTRKVNGVPIVQNYSSVDGYTTGTIRRGHFLNVDRYTLSVRTVANDGGWTVTNTSTDGQTTVATYTDGLLEESEFFDNQTVPASFASVTYTYDALARAATTIDSRTGTTTIGGYLPNGSITSVITNGGNDTTSYKYDVMGRRIETTLPDSTTSHTSYTTRGLVLATWGSQTYATLYGYDALGRMDEMRTYQGLPQGTEPAVATTGAATTTWLYDPLRGWLTEKNHPGETDDGVTDPDYTYTDAGRLKTRTWERGVETTYGYDQGALESISYSDTTPGVTHTYDSFGRHLTATQAGNKHTYAYHSHSLALQTETIDYDTDADGTADFTRVLHRHRDSRLRPGGYELKNQSGTTTDTGGRYRYDNKGRLGSVALSYPLPATPAFTYGYKPDSFGLVETVTGPAHTVTNSYESNRDILTNRENKAGVTLSNFAYITNNIGQRTSLTASGSAFTTAPIYSWSYNARGELAEADDTSTANNDRAYQYDGIGNREKTVTGLLTALPATPNYSANVLNQYTLANGVTLPVPAHDADGNLSNGPLPVATGNATLTWDAENRLVGVTTSGSTVITYTYDYLGRRKSKKVGAGTATHYVYDGWNLIAKYAGTALAMTYTWGMDLSGSMQGAGGVGGLLAVDDGTSTYYPTFDGNGNVSEYLDGTGAKVAHYEYDAFGNTTTSSGSKAGDFDHRFSTKYFDGETGLYYYGYRYYDPETGRWPSRDPIGERGGLNIYGFVGNDAVNWWDYLGLSECDECEEGDITITGFDLVSTTALGSTFTMRDPKGVVLNFLKGEAVKEGKKQVGKRSKAAKVVIKAAKTVKKFTKLVGLGAEMLTSAGYILDEVEMTVQFNCCRYNEETGENEWVGLEASAWETDLFLNPKNKDDLKEIPQTYIDVMFAAARAVVAKCEEGEDE